MPSAEIRPNHREREGSPAPPSLKESPQRWWLLVLLFTGMLFSYAHRQYAQRRPAVHGREPTSTRLTSALSSAFFIIYAFMQVPGGWLVDRFGVQRVSRSASTSGR